MVVVLALLLLLLLCFINHSSAQCTVQIQPCANGTCANQYFLIEGANDTHLCNNTYLPESCFNNVDGIDCIVTSGYLNWLLPDGRVVQSSGTVGGLIFREENEIVKGTFQIEGVYTCNQTGSQIHIGLYSDSSINKVLNVDIATIISNLLAHSSPTVEMACTIRQFPPTCLHWYHNGVEIMNQTVSLEDATETVYASRYSPQESPEGNYTCSVQSVGTEIKRNSSSMIFERLTITKVNLISASTVQVQWTQSVVNLETCIVYYKQAGEESESSFQTSSLVQANISNLTVNATYYINVLCRSSGSILFSPTPIEVILSSPGALRNVTANKSDKAYTVSWLPPAYPAGIYDKVYLNYYATCNGKTHNTTVEVNSQQISLVEMKPGLYYTAAIFASNVLGIGVQTVLSNLSLPGQAPQTPQNLKVVAVNSSSLLATWQLVTCFNSSGDPPHYILSIQKLNSQVASKITIISFSSEHYFVDLSEGSEYEVTIKAENQYSQSVESSKIGTTLQVNSSSTTEMPTSNTTTTMSSDPLPIIIGGAVGGAILAVACISVIVVIVIVASCKRKPTPTEDIDMPPVMPPVTFEQKSEVPYFKEFPDDTKASEGETVFFTVQVAGYPEPTWVWTYMGEPLSPGGNIQIFPDGTLIIKDIGTDSSGVYQFTARNVMGDISNQVQLDVEEEEEEDCFKRAMFGSTSSVLHQLIPLQALDKHVEAHHANENDGFNVQYNYLKTKTKHDTRASLAYKPLNRYRNIVPYDDNRVILKKGPGWENTYINASYINGYSKTQACKFIASQGPLQATITDFWHMIWQEKVHVVVMLVNRVEGNKVKCEEYWATSVGESQSYGPCTVKLLNEETYANFVIRDMELLVESHSQSPRHIKQFHFTSWPDHGVPEHGSPLLIFYKKIMAYHQSVGKGPILVHCSAGVGRTGTLIALDIALEQINNERGVDISGIINNMREQRMKMVQTAAQFIFLYDVVLEHALCGTTVIPVQQLGKAIQDLDTIDYETNKTSFHKQYQVIQKVTPKVSEYKHHASQGNGECIRKGLLPPSDQRRVVLRGKTPEYINATFVDGYQQKKGYIITQNPMESTVASFWKMVVQQGCSSIVLLAGNNEVGFDKDAICHQYWPSETQQSEVYSHFSVKLVSQDVYDNIVTRNFNVKDLNSGKVLDVTQLQITNWLPDGQCSNHRTIIRLLEEILIAQRRSGNNPIVIHCSDTITRSGILCATSITVEQLKAEGTVDIFQVVKTLRIQRPGTVPSVDHYKMIFDLSHSSLSMFETYNNF